MLQEIALEQAVSLMLEKVDTLTETVQLPLSQAMGLRCAENVSSPIDNPPFDRSPLDGYALRSEDIQRATKEAPVFLNVVGEVFAGGCMEGAVGPGEAARIMTGAMMPQGCDCVIRQEDTDEGEEVVAVTTTLRRHENYCFRGEDVKKGQLLIPEGERLNYVHMGILASVGYDKVKVYRHPKVGLFCTGDELTVPGQPLASGKIYNGNFQMILSRLEELHVPVVGMPPIKDDAAAVAKHIAACIDDLDLLITTGGVSVGKKDIMHEVFSLLGAERIYWKVKLKPGTPALCGLYKSKLLICLSGNPFAAITTLELLARPVLAKLTGREDLELPRLSATLESAFPKGSGQRRFIRGKLVGDRVTLPKEHSSGQLFSMAGCNCLVDIPGGTSELQPGDKVEVVVL